MKIRKQYSVLSNTDKGRGVMFGQETRTASANASNSSSTNEDSVRRRYEMEQQVAKKDSTAKKLMMESDIIRKMLE